MRIQTLSLKIIAIFLLFGLGYWTQTVVHRHEDCGESYMWLNEELRCTDEQVLDKAEYSELKLDLLEMIERQRDGGYITNAAVYFRDLSNGPTMGINQYMDFVPASLLKVPLMLTYLRLAEDDPALLERELTFLGPPDDFTQGIPPGQAVEVGKIYEIRDLLRRLIVYSDNGAWDVLYNYLGEISPDLSLLAETYHELGIIEPQSAFDEVITVKSYASIFRLLYNSSYLSKEHSSMALDLLSQTVYTHGLRQGIPRTIPIAHKFGERFTEDYNQLHDCGIVYYPGNAYLLCVMTRGSDFAKLAEFIGEVSAAVYEEVDSRRK